MCRCPNILECVCLQKFGVCLADFNTVSRRDCASLIYEIPQSLQGTVPYMSPQACRVSVYCDVCVHVYVSGVALLVWPHEVEPWSHSWYRGRVETLDAKYNLIFR